MDSHLALPGRDIVPICICIYIYIHTVLLKINTGIIASIIMSTLATFFQS